MFPLSFAVGANQSPVVHAETQSLQIPNSGFESANKDGSPKDWFIEENESRATTAAISDTRAHSGESSLWMENPEGKGVLVRSTNIPTEPGVTHSASAYVFNESGSGWVYLEFWDDDGRRLMANHIETSSTGEWEKGVVEAVSPNNTASVTVTLFGSRGLTGVSYFDDVELTREVAEYDPYIGSEKVLFVDETRIENMEHLSLEIHEATKLPDPVLVPDKPWETNNAYVYGQVMYDDEDKQYKMWYHSYDREAAEYYVLYATSPDGIEWHKPELGVYEYKGSKNNNIVGNMHSPSVIKDKSASDPSRLYKMMAYDYDVGYSVYFSPDGIHWTANENNPVFPGADVVTAFYDEQTDQFVAMSKQYEDVAGISRRSVYVSYSEDFVNWSPPKLVLIPDERDDATAKALGYGEYTDIYGMGVMPYEGIYIGFPWMFYHIGTNPSDGPIDVQIAFSRDLENWQRDNRKPVIPLGAGGSFDSGMNFTVSKPIIVNDEIWVYYGGWNGFHGTPLPQRSAATGLAKWRLDGFTSIKNGGYTHGTLTTKPITFNGDKLVVNVDVKGSLQIEVLDNEGSVIEGFERDKSIPITGDFIEHQVKWEGNPDLGRLSGEEVKLRFYLDDGDLYSFQFKGTNDEPDDSKLEAITLSSKKTTLDPEETVELSVIGVMDDGSEVNLIDSPLDEAQLQFQSSHSDLVDIDENGQLTLSQNVQDVRSFEVWADVSLNNKTFKSNILQFDITVSIPLIRSTLDYFKDNDAIQTPLYKQLSNRLNQAEHHQENGRTKQAIKHLEDFKKHLHNEGMQKFISAEAKEVLDKDVQVLISSW